MEIIILLVAASLCLAITFLVAFIWAVRSGQFKDKYTPAMRVLFDDERL